MTLMISQSQMEIFDAAARRSGNLRLARYIGDRFPGILEGYDDAEQIAVSEKYRLLAGVFDFVDDEQIGYFMVLVIMFGLTFPSHPCFAHIMQDKTLSADSKLLHIRAVLAWEGLDCE